MALSRSPSAAERIATSSASASSSSPAADEPANAFDAVLETGEGPETATDPVIGQAGQQRDTRSLVRHHCPRPSTSRRRQVVGLGTLRRHPEQHH